MEIKKVNKQYAKEYIDEVLNDITLKKYDTSLEARRSIKLAL
jgi:hypothetical protein